MTLGTTLIGILVVLLMYAITLVPVAQILHRTGYSRWLSLYALIPFINIVAVWEFAFAEWPIEKIRRDRQKDSWSAAQAEEFKELVRAQLGQRT